MISHFKTTVDPRAKSGTLKNAEINKYTVVFLSRCFRRPINCIRYKKDSGVTAIIFQEILVYLSLSETLSFLRTHFNIFRSQDYFAFSQNRPSELSECEISVLEARCYLEKATFKRFCYANCTSEN